MARTPALVVHDGDIKSGSSICSDDILTAFRKSATKDRVNNVTGVETIGPPFFGGVKVTLDAMDRQVYRLSVRR